VTRAKPQNIWVVKCREVKADGTRGWHWRYYLPGDDCDRELNEPSEDWGGQDWIKSNLSKKLIREEVQAGDGVICYQCDTREIVGLTRMASAGKDDPPGSGDYNCFDLAPPREALRLDPPLRMRDLYASGCHPRCFAPGTQGTLFRVDQQEFEAIRTAIIRNSSGMRKRVAAWLDRAGRRPAEPRR